MTTEGRSSKDVCLCVKPKFPPLYLSFFLLLTLRPSLQIELPCTTGTVLSPTNLSS